LGPSAGEHGRERVIALMASILVYRSGRSAHGDLPGPRPSEGGWVVYRESIPDGVRACAREPLDHVQVAVRPAIVSLVREIGRIDHQRVALPTTARVAHPLPDVGWDVWTPIER